MDLRPIARRSNAESVGLLVADEFFFDGVELQLALENPGDGCCMARDV